MGTCNALRTTETYTTENFTLIQLEEERQKLKKKELLKNMLTDGEFSIKGQCAINLMMTKLEIINTFLLMKYNRSFIQMTTGRLKSYDSVCKKMQKKELDLNFAQALEKINDILSKTMKEKNFGNARYIDKLITKLLMKHAENVYLNQHKNLLIITKDDVDENEILNDKIKKTNNFGFTQKNGDV